MNEMETFERLAVAARREPSPPIDVANRVLAAIAPPRPGRTVDLPLAIFSGLSLAAALVALAVAIQAWSVLSDPLAGFLGPLTVVMQ